MMNFADTYIQRFAVDEPIISSISQPDLGVIVVIPCFSEPDIELTLTQLFACIMPHCSVEIIVVVNYSETTSEEVKQENNACFAKLTAYAQAHNTAQCALYPLLAANLPKKHAGVGLARKIGMDQAIHRFAYHNTAHGVICCFDADSTARANYLQEVYAYFTKTSCGVACIHFEHPLQGDLPQVMYDAIAQYELHLRIYVEALKHMGFPYAYHTVGSSMAVRADAYCRQGGMNKRQAGEDFYFLQKLFQAEKTGNITGTCIIPSSRISHRVPFGTGHAMKEMMEAKEHVYYTYHPDSYSVLADVFSRIPELFTADCLRIKTVYAELHVSYTDFVSVEDFLGKVSEIQNHASSLAAFEKRIFLWMNGFFIFKYLNTAHQSFFSKIPVQKAACIVQNKPFSTTLTELLLELREIQKLSRNLA